MRSKDLTERLARLADAVEGIDLGNAARLGHEGTIVLRDRISGTIRSYLIPRTEHPDTPLLVVIAGPTGVGKSTLVNSLTGLDLTVAGAIRPTTSKPLVLAGHAADGRSAAEESSAEVVIGGAPILQHMTFVDTPDIDSTSTSHRVVAESFIDRADIVVFVVSASRYADHVPWEVLRRAVSRGATVVPVINRLGPGAAGVAADFASRLRVAGLDVPPVRVPEHHLAGGAQHVPGPAVRELRRRLFKVAKTQREHQAEVMARVLNSTVRQVADLAARVEALRAEVVRMAVATSEGLSAGPVIEPDPGRDWASSPRKRSGRRLARLLGGRGEDDWMSRVADRLAAELESRLRADIVRHGRGVLDDHLTAGTMRASAMIEGAVDSWIRFVGRISEASGISPAELIEGVLSGPVVAVDADDPLAQARRDLEGRLGVVWQHYGALLAEGWMPGGDDPGASELRELAAAVAAAHQFADA